MIKITAIEGNDAPPGFRVEGRVTEGVMQDLIATCEPSLGNGNVLLDLGGVTFIDRRGTSELRRLERRGAVLVGCSGYVRQMLQSEAADKVSGAADGQSLPSDEMRLVERLRAGDGAACEALVREHSGRLLALARRMLGSDHDAEDAVQDAFLSAFRSIDGFSGDARLSTWLHRITVNACLMKMRSRRRRPEQSIDDLLPRFKDDGEWATPPSKWEQGADTLLEDAEARALVRRHIDRLPESYRTVLVLRDIEDLDTAEVADQLGISANAVKIRLHRARQALRTLLGQVTRD